MAEVRTFGAFVCVVTVDSISEESLSTVTFISAHSIDAYRIFVANVILFDALVNVVTCIAIAVKAFAAFASE